MKYIVLGEDNKEYGPIDGETLKKWVETGRVLPETQVRNSLIKKWNKAQDFDFLKPSFIKQFETMEEQKGPKEKTLEAISSIFKKKPKKKKNIFFEDGTAFRHHYLPDQAGVFLRIMAFLFDGIVILIYFVLVFLLASLAVQAGGNVNSVFDWAFPLFICGIVFYYALMLGLFAQTFGMWFWGMILVLDDLDEVFLGRAYAFTILMLLIGFLSPLFVFLYPAKLSIHEILTGTRIIRTAARPKA